MASKEGKRLASSRGSREGKELKMGPAICTACDSGNPATKYCQQCPDHLCAECTKIHRGQRRTKAHQLTDVKVSESIKQLNYNTCSQHVDHVLDKWCLKCCDVTCDVCMKQEHRGHQIKDVTECEEQIFNQCLDRTKELQGPFKNMKRARRNIHENRQRFTKNCKAIKEEINKRKIKLINMITEVADAAIAKVTDTDQEVGKLYSQTSGQLDQVLNDFEGVVTPMAIGTDIHNIIKRMLYITTEIREANNVLCTVDLLDKKSDIKLEDGGGISEIEEKTKKYFNIKTSNLPGSVPPKISAKIKSNKSGAVTATNTAAAVSAIPRQIKLVDRTKIDTYYYMSRHVEPNSFLTHAFLENSPCRMSYTTQAKVLDNKLSYAPEAKDWLGEHILTITENRHVVVSKESINLLDNSKVLQSKPHTNDGYIPDILGYIDQHKFVSVWKKGKKLRYHDANTLEVLNTYSLCTKSLDDFEISDENGSVLCTSDGNILLQIGGNKLIQFTAEGTEGITVPVHGDFFQCNWLTKCIDQNDNIFGVIKNDGSIHVFGLRGEHHILDKIDTEYVWSAGLDNNGRFYLCYTSKQLSHFLAKYKY